ncbi:MAG: nucleotidyltransferase, partial [Bacteroidetes bacterium]
KKVKVKRPNRDFLLSIKAGKIEYAELLQMAEEKRSAMEAAFENSSLPDRPDLSMINDLAYRLRDRFYNAGD